MTSKRWTEEEIEFLQGELAIGSSHESIGVRLGRTKSSVMHKVQRLGLSKQGMSWIHLSNEDMLDLVRKYKTAEEFDTNPELPSYKTLVRRFKVDNWNTIRELAGVPVSKGTRYDHSKLTTFYIIKFMDENGIEFYKYGVTQRPLRTRYSGRVFEIVKEEVSSLEEALKKEHELSKLVVPYTPMDEKFYSKGHGGYTECFISYLDDI